MRQLSAKEQETFRKEFLEKEREVQRNIGIYLSGLVLVTGWIVGPQSRPLLAMILGNDGYNIYAILLLVVLNLIFTTFLIYKSLFIHEVTQFSAVLSPPESGFTYWESWRRSSQSATKPVRTIYTVVLAVLPVVISAVLLFVIGRVLYGDAQSLSGKLATINSSNSVPTPDELSLVFSKAKYAFWFDVVLHAIPFYFLYQNIGPVYWRWNRIAAKHFTKDFEHLWDEEAVVHETHYTLTNKETAEVIGTVDEQQMAFLKLHLTQESETDSDYYLTQETITGLHEAEADTELYSMLKRSLGRKKHIEITWSSNDS